MKTAEIADLPIGPGTKNALQRFLREARVHDELGAVVLFGSAARGQMGPDSDVDVLVDWNGKEGEARRLLSGIATEIFLDTGLLISVHPVAPAHRALMQSIPTRFYEAVEREGVALAG